MNLVRTLRQKKGLTQKELATRAGTSQSTIAAYESGTKSPTLRTLENLAASVGLQLEADFIPPMTREDQRSLAFHEALVRQIEQNPQSLIRLAKSNLQKLCNLHPHASELLTQWTQWLDLPLQHLIENMLDKGLESREMRQVSPFSGILSAKERADVLRKFRQEAA